MGEAGRIATTWFHFRGSAFQVAGVRAIGSLRELAARIDELDCILRDRDWADILPRVEMQWPG